MLLSTASNTRRLMAAALLAGSAVLAGCAGIRTVNSEVSSFGEWPDGRSAGTYAFERLPSQQAQAAETEMLENAARPALEKAGFKPAAAGQQPEVLVQVGARDSRFVMSPWDDPLWWRGGFGYWRGGPWLSPRWGLSMRYDFPRYESQWRCCCATAPRASRSLKPAPPRKAAAALMARCMARCSKPRWWTFRAWA